MRRKVFLVLALVLGITSMQAKPVDVATAKRLGLSFAQSKAMIAKTASQQIDLAYTAHAENGMTTAFVFNLDEGFVIVSADDCYHPILGYAYEGQFNYDAAPDGMRFMLGELSNDIARCVSEKIPTTSKVACEWKNLEVSGQLHPERSLPVIDMLVQQRWDQGSPYNMYVPSGCPTGCVATAMAQLMKYWEWPVTGTGSHSYEWNGQTLSADFGATTYDWNNMVNNYTVGNITTEQKQAVATLMWHCGVAVNMNYEPDGSGAFSYDVPNAINEYFSYSEHSTHISRSGSYDDWIALLKTNLDQYIPIYYSGQSSDGGHAFICDGYDTDGLFHFNWGWGGAYNNFFLIDGENFDYSGSQAIVYDFIPNYVYDGMPQPVTNLSVSIDSDVSRIAHLTWTNPTTTLSGTALTSIDKVIIKRNDVPVQEITGTAPGQTVNCDDEVPYFDQFEYTVHVVTSDNYGRTAKTKAVFGPYCEWTVLMTSSGFQGWDGGGITVQNAAGSYIDFLTTTTASAQMQRFQMALGNNNLYWVKPNSNINNISFKVKDTQNQIVYQYEGPSADLEEGLLRTLNNSCGNENTCEAPYNLVATVDADYPENVILTWESNHEPEFGYCIYRDGLLLNMAHETRYVDEYTNPGGHCYFVTALCNGGETANSNDYCVTSGAGCNEPTGLYFEYTSNKKVQLFWTAPEGTSPAGYVVYRKTDEMATYKEIKRVKQTNVKDTSCSQGTPYQYAVVAYYDSIDCTSTYASDLLDPLKYYIRVEWSNAPQELKAEWVDNSETKGVNLRWHPAFLATNYKIMRGGEMIGETVEASFTDELVALGETHCYQVIAVGEDYEEASDEVCITIPDAPVLPCSAPTELKQGTDWPSVVWTAPDDRVPDSYTVVVVDHLLNDETKEITGVTGTTYVDELPTEGLALDRSYQVKAVYPECESEFALTAEGDNLIHISNLEVPENTLSAILYPNPTTGQLTIEMEGMTFVEVYNLVGQRLLQQPVSESSAVVDMSNLQNGVYIIKVNTLAGSIMQKVVKIN